MSQQVICVKCKRGDFSDRCGDRVTISDEGILCEKCCKEAGLVECDCDNCREYEIEYYKVATAECPDIDYFETIKGAKAFCDKHSLNYGAIMLCDKDKNEIGDYGDYVDEDDTIICVECKRDFSYEVDDRSSFEEIGKIICEKCFLKE